jgi:tRNA uridine 5-carbamoylmethylation protein Kti12
MQTIVINLYGGPSVGKSTLSADTFAKLKLSQKSCELAGEYVKNWVWNGQAVREWDQIYILGKQIRRESLLYNRVEFIIADSPILLVPFYEQYLFNHNIVMDSAIKFINYAQKKDVKYVNFWLERPEFFESEGRNQGLDEAKVIDEKMRQWPFN